MDRDYRDSYKFTKRFISDACCTYLLPTCNLTKVCVMVIVCGV